MLVTFTTKAYADITMFGDVAEVLLKMMGHTATVPGAISAADVPEALQRLTSAIEQQPAPAAPDPADDDDALPVSLSRRALPLLELLEAAKRDEVDVMWK